MAKMTKAQAEAAIQKAVAGDGDKGYALIEKHLPKVQKANKDLQAELKKAESAEMIDTLVKGVRLHLKGLAEGIALLTGVLARLKEATDDEELFALVEKDITDAMKTVTTKLEAARNTARESKLALDAADKFESGHSGDADAAGEDWTTALTEFKRITDAAMKEAAPFAKWEADAKAAADARDKAKLAKLRGARPATPMLATIEAWKTYRDAFAAFDKAYKLAELPKALQDEINADRAKAMVTHLKARQALGLTVAVEQRVRDLKVEARDGRKALGELKLPAAALPKLQALIDGPEGALPAGLEALAKAHKVPGKGKDMVAALKRAGVL